MRRIKVMIVDDSAIVCQVATEQLREDPGIEVIHAVADPLLAMERMKHQWPDVIVLDVEMRAWMGSPSCGRSCTSDRRR